MQDEGKLLVSNVITLKIPPSRAIDENKMDYFKKLIKEEFDSYD